MSNFHQFLDRQHFQLLLALRDTGQLSRAAEVLNISASAASHRLKEAERRLGVLLAVPSGRSLELTPSGLHLADVAAGVESGLRSAESVARWIGSRSVPTVRLAMEYHDTAPWFTRLAGHEDTEVRVDVVRVAYGTGSNAVWRHSVDLSIDVVATATEAADTTELNAPLVAKDRLMAAVPADHPAAQRGVLEPEDLITESFLTAGPGPTIGFEHSEFMVPAEVRPARVIRIESVALILDQIAAGRGITIQPGLSLCSVKRRAETTEIEHVESLGRRPNVAIVPLSGPDIEVRWVATMRPDPDPATATVLAMIRKLVRPTTESAMGR